MSRGISLRPRFEQSTIVPAQLQPEGQALSIRHSPAKRVRNSSWPKNKKELNVETLIMFEFYITI